jgi:hypothetical protein
MTNSAALWHFYLREKIFILVKANFPKISANSVPSIVTINENTNVSELKQFPTKHCQPCCHLEFLFVYVCICILYYKYSHKI